MTQPNLATRDLTHSSYIGDFREGQVFHHGAVQIIPARNRAYIDIFNDGLILGANPALAKLLGYEDLDANSKLAKYGPTPIGLVSQGLVFNTGFGLSVHGISFNARANRSYSNLLFGVHVFEWDILSAQSTVLGTLFSRDNSDRGDVQVKTIVSNQRNETVLEYVRVVTVNAALGQTHAKSNTTKPQPAAIDLRQVFLPNPYHGLPRGLLGEHGKTFEQFVVKETYHGLSAGSLTFQQGIWIPAITMNDAVVHYTPPNFIVYGGTVKAVAEGQVSGHFPLARHLGMNSGTHPVPTYPSDTVKTYFQGSDEEQHEQLRSRIEVVEATAVPGREDIGILRIKLITDKVVTAAGERALRAAGLERMIESARKEGPDTLLEVLNLEQVLAVPTEKAFT